MLLKKNIEESSSISVLSCIIPVPIHKDERREIIQNQLKNKISEFQNVDIMSYDIVFDSNKSSYVTEFNAYVSNYNQENLEKIVNALDKNKFPKESYIKDQKNNLFYFGNLEGIKIIFNLQSLENVNTNYKIIRKQIQEKIDNLKYYGHNINEDSITLYIFTLNSLQKKDEIISFLMKNYNEIKYDVELI